MQDFSYMAYQLDLNLCSHGSGPCALQSPPRKAHCFIGGARGSYFISGTVSGLGRITES